MYPEPSYGSATELGAKATATPFDAAMSSFDATESLAGRVRSIVDRLTGSALTGVIGEAGPRPPVNGLLPCLAERANDARRAVSAAHEALDRLEKVLS